MIVIGGLGVVLVNWEGFACKEGHGNEAMTKGKRCQHSSSASLFPLLNGRR